MTDEPSAERIAVDALIPSFAAGGSERVVLTFLNALPRDRFDVRLMVLNPAGPLRDLAERHAPAIPLRGMRLRTALPDILRRVRRRRPDLLFCSQFHLNVAMLLAAPLLGATRLVVREANMPSLCLESGHWPRWAGRLYRAGLPKAHRVIATSNGMAEEFRRDFRVPADRIAVLPNPVDVAALRAAADPPVRGAGPGRRFVAVGRLVRQKGFDRLLDWAAVLEGDDRLTVIGDGPEGEALRRHAAAGGLEDRVEFVGFRAAPWPVVAGADALLMPSRWEGMPNAALEALACGTPVIATTESGGIADVAAAAEPGAVTLAADEAAFVAAMRAVRPAPPATLRASRLPAAYEVERAASRFRELLEDAVGCA